MTSLDFATSRPLVGHLQEYHVKRFILDPQKWQGYSNVTTLSWAKVKFSGANRKHLPGTQGVYVFVASPSVAGLTEVGYVLYVGRANGTTIKTRFGDYLREKESSNPRIHIRDMLHKWSDHLWYYYATAAAGSVDQLEEDLIEAFLPPFNRDFPSSVRDLIKTVFE